MQNNFDKLKHLFEFEEEEVYGLPFFNVAVIQPSKDSSDRIIKQYCITSIDNEQEIITLCETFEAVAYIDPQPRSYRNFAIELNYELSERMKNDNYDKLNEIIFKAASECKTLEDKWIINITDSTDLMSVKTWLLQPYGDDDFPLDFPNAHIYDVVKTNNGYHIITGAFNLEVFSNKFPNVEVKQNAMTLLYYPQSLTV